jgi:hypothetical protein
MQPEPPWPGNRRARLFLLSGSAIRNEGWTRAADLPLQATG